MSETAADRRPPEDAAETTLGEGQWLRLVDLGGWEYVRRVRGRGVVVMIAATPEGKLLLVEQHRPSVRAPVIELPAGLAGDLGDAPDEALAEAARRELEEETGYRPARVRRLCAGPTSAGVSCEVVVLYLCEDLEKVGEGGGDEFEDIRVHEVPFDELEAFLAAAEARGCLVDPKVYSAGYFAHRGGAADA